MPHSHNAMFESVLISVLLIAMGVAYARGSLRRHRLSRWQTASFILGLFFIWLAIASPLAALDHQLLTGHMIQHLLLMSIAAPLLWLGAPIESLRHGLPRRFMNAMVTPLFRSGLTRQMLKALTHPAVCWLTATVALIGWHIPTAFALGMRSETWHSIEQASFLASGLLFWWPVIQAWHSSSRPSEWSIILYLFLATLPCDILSGFLVFCDRVIYPAYSFSSHSFRLSALEDQQRAGALMWTVVTVVFLLAGTVFTARLLSPLSSPRTHSPIGPLRRSGTAGNPTEYGGCLNVR